MKLVALHNLRGLGPYLRKNRVCAVFCAHEVQLRCTAPLNEASPSKLCIFCPGEKTRKKQSSETVNEVTLQWVGKSPCVWCGRCSGFIRSVFTETVLTWFYNPPALFAGHGSVVAVVDLLLRLIRWVRGFTGGMSPQVLSICLVFQRFIRVVKLNRL